MLAKTTKGKNGKTLPHKDHATAWDTGVRVSLLESVEIRISLTPDLLNAPTSSEDASPAPNLAVSPKPSSCHSCCEGTCKAAPGEASSDATQILRHKIAEAAGLLMRSPNPDEAARTAVGWLMGEVRYRADLLLGRRRSEALQLPADPTEEDRFERERLALLEDLWQGCDPA